MTPNPRTFNFSEALELMKQGKRVSRVGWRNPSIKVFVQFPDEHSANTIPYMVMEKGDRGVGDYKRFPLDLSAESVFADDWCEVIA